MDLVALIHLAMRCISVFLVAVKKRLSSLKDVMFTGTHGPMGLWRPAALGGMHISVGSGSAALTTAQPS